MKTLEQGNKVKIRFKNLEGEFICYKEVFVSTNSSVKKRVALVDIGNGNKQEFELHEVRLV